MGYAKLLPLVNTVSVPDYGYGDYILVNLVSPHWSHDGSTMQGVCLMSAVSVYFLRLGFEVLFAKPKVLDVNNPY